MRGTLASAILYKTPCLPPAFIRSVRHRTRLSCRRSSEHCYCPHQGCFGRWSDLSPSRRETLRQRGTLQALAPDLRTSVCRIIEDVRTQGDEGLLRALAEFDGCAIDQTRLRVSDEEFARARDNVDAELLAAIRDGISHIQRFNERLTRDREWNFVSEPGLVIGEKMTPIESAGLFIPGGKASYPSVLMHLGTAASVAGVPKVVVAIPPLPNMGGTVDEAVLVVSRRAGIARCLPGEWASRCGCARVRHRDCSASPHGRRAWESRGGLCANGDPALRLRNGDAHGPERKHDPCGQYSRSSASGS